MGGGTGAEVEEDAAAQHQGQQKREEGRGERESERESRRAGEIEPSAQIPILPAADIIPCSIRADRIIPLPGFPIWRSPRCSGSARARRWAGLMSMENCLLWGFSLEVVCTDLVHTQGLSDTA